MPEPSSPFITFGLWRTAALGHVAFNNVHALIEAVAAEIGVGGVLPHRLDPIGGPDHVLAADFERINLQKFGQIIDRRLDRERGLRRPVAAKAAARDHVGVDSESGRLLVGAAIGGYRAAERLRQGLAPVAAVSAGIGDHVDLHCGQGSVPFGAKLHPGRHLMACRCADELLLASELPFHRPAQFHGREQAKILGDHLLLAAEAAADALGEDVQVARAQTEDMAELLLGDERRLRAGAHVQPSIVAAPSD